METRAGRMISIEVGVRDESTAREVESALMDKPSPSPGDERAITEHTTLKFLRSFDVSETAAPNEPSIWVDFTIRYSEPAEADPIAEGLVVALGDRQDDISLRLDKTDVAVKKEAVRRVLEKRLEALS